MASSKAEETEVELTSSLELDHSSFDLTNVEHRNYYLNKEKAVHKKLKINDLFVESKDNGQCLLAQLNFDTFMYFASVLLNFYKDSCKIKFVRDKNQSLVEVKIPVTEKKSKKTVHICLYNTNNRIMIQGKKASLSWWRREKLPIILNNIDENSRVGDDEDDLDSPVREIRDMLSGASLTDSSSTSAATSGFVSQVLVKNNEKSLYLPNMTSCVSGNTTDFTTPQLTHRKPTSQYNGQEGQEEPPWVQGLLSKFFTRMDKIEDKLDKIINRVSRLESEISAIPPLKDKVNELEKSVEFLSKTYDTVRGELKANYEEIKKLKSESNSRVSELECRTMRDNLLFTGVPEQPRENAEQTGKEIIHSKLGFSQAVEFERVHRVGYHSSSGRPRTIVAKFSRFKDREMIRTNARFLKGTKIGIHEQFSKEINDKRKLLYPKFKRARENNQYAKLILDYLIIDNQKYIVNSEGNIERDTFFNKPPPPRGKADNNQVKYDRSGHRNHYIGHSAPHAQNKSVPSCARSDTNTEVMTQQFHHNGQDSDNAWHRDRRHQFE